MRHGWLWAHSMGSEHGVVVVHVKLGACGAWTMMIPVPTPTLPSLRAAALPSCNVKAVRIRNRHPPCTPARLGGNRKLSRRRFEV